MPHGFDSHDHSDCITGALARAEAYCAKNKLQLTATRRRVLEILLEQHKALGAYEILAVLETEGLGGQPPVVYRALDFLVKHAMVHKIEQISAYVACTHGPGQDAQPHSPVFLICRACGTVEEAHANPVSGTLGQIAEQTGFVIEHTVIEARGLCPRCQEAA